MARKIDTNPLENYRNRVDLFEFNGELNGYDYGASGELESEADIERLSGFPEVEVEPGDETYKGIEVQVLFTDEHYDRVGEALF